jgi:2-methylisocitrate lyase-like PEP mutase family enzyme
MSTKGLLDTTHATEGSPSMTKKTTIFRQLLNAPEILAMPGVYDGFSLRLAERHGFKAAVISGAGLSESKMGWADVGLMGLEENVSVARRLDAFSTIPLLADADTGYGNAVNVFFTVRAFEDAGVAGIALEDQTWPTRCGHMAGKSVIDMAEMVEKVHAAVDARRDPDFVIKARTDAAGVLGIDEAIRRLNAYVEAGADHVVADAVLEKEHIQRLTAEVDRPVAVNMGFGIRQRSTTPLITAKTLQEQGVAAVTYPRLMTSAALRGMEQALDALKGTLESDEPIEREDLTVSFEEINGLMGLDQLRALEDRFAQGVYDDRRDDRD